MINLITLLIKLYLVDQDHTNTINLSMAYFRLKILFSKDEQTKSMFNNYVGNMKKLLHARHTHLPYQTVPCPPAPNTYWQSNFFRKTRRFHCHRCGNVPDGSANNIFNNCPVLPIKDSLWISSAYRHRPPAAPHRADSREIDISLQVFKISDTNCSLKKMVHDLFVG